MGLRRHGFEMSAPFMDSPLPSDENARLACFPDYDILGTDPEPQYDALVALAASIFKVPICLISLIGADEQWLKARCGIDLDRTARNVICTHTILSSHPLIVLNSTDDDRFRGNPLVTGDPNIRFYAGAPLINAKGVHLGAFCLIDDKPHTEFTEVDRDLLVRFAGIVSERLDGPAWTSTSPPRFSSISTSNIPTSTRARASLRQRSGRRPSASISTLWSSASGSAFACKAWPL